MERTYEAPSNEALDMILGYHQGRLVTYLQFEFFRNSKGPSSEPQPPCYTICCTVVAIWNQFWSIMIAASEPSSEFRRNLVADCNFDFLDYFAETMSPMFLDYFVTTTSPIHLFIFDDDLGHGNHSGELPLFVGCIVNFVVSYLICMFQDSVPAGSYNDPFLSSVWGGATTFHCTYLQHAMPLKVFLYLTQKRHATLVGVLLNLTQSCHATLVDAQEAEIEFFQVKHAPWNFHGMLEDTMVRP